MAWAANGLRSACRVFSGGIFLSPERWMRWSYTFRSWRLWVAFSQVRDWAKSGVDLAETGGDGFEGETVAIGVEATTALAFGSPGACGMVETRSVVELLAGHGVSLCKQK
jgi:hypothetical protein